MRRQRVVLALLAAALLAVAACSRQEGLPAGSYAGTIFGRQAIRLDVGGDVRVNNVKAKSEPGGDITLTSEALGQVRISCKPTDDKATELTCTATSAANKVKVSFPLMRL